MIIKIQGTFSSKEITINGNKISKVFPSYKSNDSREELPDFSWGKWCDQREISRIGFSILMQFYSEKLSLRHNHMFIYGILKPLRLTNDGDFYFEIDIDRWFQEQEDSYRPWTYEDSLAAREDRQEVDRGAERRKADRDNFDAMTDGHLGSYDDFIERGGDTDDINEWAGR